MCEGPIYLLRDLTTSATNVLASYEGSHTPTYVLRRMLRLTVAHERFLEPNGSVDVRKSTYHKASSTVGTPYCMGKKHLEGVISECFYIYLIYR